MSDDFAQQPNLTLAGARRLLTAATARAESLGVRVVVTVVGRAGDLIALERHDGAPQFCLTAATKKAWTAAAAGANTLAFGTAFQADPALLHALAPKIDEVMAVGGGEPVLINGAVAGAVGVSGATEAQDDEIARAAVAAFGG